MSFSKESAVTRAKTDLAQSLGISGSQVRVVSVRDKSFSDASLGAPSRGEMSAQILTDGWEIVLGANGKNYEYRADKHQVRPLSSNKVIT